MVSWGAGVTARDEADALALLGDVVGAELPPRLKTIHDVTVDRAALGLPDFLTVGDPSRRGVWLPATTSVGRLAGDSAPLAPSGDCPSSIVAEAGSLDAV